MTYELTKSFVEELLGQPLKSVELSAGCAVGDGIASSLSSIKATTKTGEEIHAVFKTVPPKEQQKFDVMEYGVFRTEGAVYDTLAQCLTKLVKERGGNYELPLPKLYKVFHNDVNDYICMEDVRPKGYKMPRVFDGLKYPETSLVLRELAAFHAFTYFLIRQVGEKEFTSNGKFDRFDPSPWRNPEKLAEFNYLIEASCKTAVKVLEKSDTPHLAAKLREAAPAGKAGGMMQAIPESTDKQFFPCLVHGDFWSNNFLIQHEQIGDERRPVSVRFVDFQFTRRGNIFEDLVYFIFTSTDTAFRSQHLVQVLHDYFDSFQKSLASINFPMPINFTRGFLIDSFFSLTRYSLVHMTFAIPLQMGNPLHLHSSEDANENGEQKPPAMDPEDPMGLFVLMINSPRAIKRLQEITQEILG